MRVLLNTRASAGSYDMRALLSTALTAVTAPNKVQENYTTVPGKGFLRGQIIYLWRMLRCRDTWREKLSTLFEAVRLLVEYARLKIALRFSRAAAPIRG
jgi:hypothetical protein